MSMLTIVADQTIHEVTECFSHLGDVKVLPNHALTNDVLVKTKAEILLIRSKTKINQELLAGTNIHFIGSTVSGTDHIDFDYLNTTSIQLSAAQGCNANSVANYCLLAWCELQQKKQQSLLLEGQKIGIVGYGKTAQKLIDKLMILKADILCYDPPFFSAKAGKLKSRHSDSQLAMGCVNVTHQLTDIMSCSLISLHASLHHKPPYSSYHLIDQNCIQQLTEKQTFINASRGEIVDEQALLTHIQKVPFSLVIDCWQNEPYINAQLLSYVHTATPHIAGHSIQAKYNGTIHCYRDLLKHLGNTSAEILPIQKPCNHNQTEIYEVDLSTCYTKEEVFFRLNQAHYLPSRDQLKKTENRQQLAQQFKHYRDNYPRRYELDREHFVVRNVPKHLQKFVQQIDQLLA